MSLRRGIPFVVAAPSGTGKTTVCRAVVDSVEGIEFSVSHTTRKPRQGERDGVDYHFLSESAFRELAERGGFLEYAEYNGNLYGTSWSSIEEPLAEGRDVLLEIEVQGARQVRSRRDDARLILLLPPSMEELARRLRGRGTDSPEIIEKRLAIARHEITAMEWFDYLVVNDDLDSCIGGVGSIIEGERRGDTREAQAAYGRAHRLEALRQALCALPASGG